MANVFYKDYTPNVTFLNTKKPTCEECFDYFIQFLSNFSFFKPKDLVDLDGYTKYFVKQI